MNQEVKKEITQPVSQSSTGEKAKCFFKTNKNQFIRAFFMILFVIIKWAATMVFYFVAILQFIFALFTKTPNQHLLNFNQSLSAYIYQILLFVGYNSETKPFPFSPWPNQ